MNEIDSFFLHQLRGYLPNYEKVMPRDKIQNRDYTFDYLNAYRYGNNCIKYVYIKKGAKSVKGDTSILAKSIDSLDGCADETSRAVSSVKRAKRTIQEIALCNEFSHFCTFTVNPDCYDRFDLNTFRDEFTHLIRNLNRSRTEKIKYLLIPERHKNGAWHLHGLLSGLKVGKDLRPNEYGYLDWAAYSSRFGFFSCSVVKSRTKAANYITKYVTKDFATFAAANHLHSFFASKGLKRRECLVYKEDISAAQFNALGFDFENEYCAIRTVYF